MPEPIHLAAEFAFNSKGKAVTVQEGTSVLRAARVFHVAVCMEGFREDNPSFGVPELAWKTVPLNLRGFEAAIRRSVPEADLDAIESAEGAILSQRLVQIEVE